MKLRDTAERRPVTILHCDIVDSTKLVDQLDPEEVLGVVEQFLELTTDLVTQHSGTVAGFTGDGIEAYFGYPITTETPAIGAINAALDIRNALTSNQLKLPFQLQCRIGVATGVAVIGTPESGELGRRLMAYGAVAHMAERLQSAAKSDQVYIDTETRDLIAQNFSYAVVGTAKLKGFEQNVEMTEVLDQLNPSSRFDYTAQHAVPISGRQHIKDVLLDRWAVAEEGEGQVVHLLGDAGIGKSRSLYEFEKSISDQHIPTFRFQCSNQHSSSPLHPWVHYVQRQANFRQSDDAAERSKKAHTYLLEQLELPESLLALSLSLLGVDVAEESESVAASPRAALSDLQAFLVNSLIEFARQSAVLVIFEDVQWIDATSRAGLDDLVSFAQQERILIGITSRPEVHPITGHSHLTSLSLVKLSKAEIRQMISNIVSHANGKIDDENVEQIVQRSDGNPLYIEELTSMFLEQPEAAFGKDSAGVHIQVPMILQNFLLARIDHTKHGQDLAQIAAVIGESFTQDQIQSLTVQDAASVAAGLSELVESNVLKSSRQRGSINYEFRHSLLRDAIYGSLRTIRRSQIHAVIALELESEQENDVRATPDLIAYHYEAADDWKNAFRCWVVAGERALRSGATTEAISLISKALQYSAKAYEEESLLPYLFRASMANGFAINAVRGPIGDPGAEFKRASEIADQLGDLERTVEALDWQFGVTFNAGRLAECTEPAERLIEIGRSSDSQLPFMAGLQAMGMVYFNQGDFRKSVEQFELLFDQVTDLVSGEHCFPSLSLSYFAWAQCMLGNRDEACELANRAIESSAGESPHAYTIALSNCSYVYHMLGETELLQRFNAELNDHCTEAGEFMYSRRAAIMRDYLLSQRVKTADYVPAMQENLAALIDANEETEITYLLALLAEVQIDVGMYEGAADSLMQAIEIANRNGEMFCYSKLNSLLARVVENCPGRFENIEPGYYLEQAIAVASEQGAKISELEARQYRNTVEPHDEGVIHGPH